MRPGTVTVLVLLDLLGLAAALCVGIYIGSEPKLMLPIRRAVATNLPWLKSVQTTAKTDSNSPYDMYDYPTIKWRAKALADSPGAIAQLWTTYEAQVDDQHRDQPNTSGTMKYRLTLFKASANNNREVQLLDANGFKLLQFNASDFHQISGASDLMEARDGVSCKEGEYRKIQDYSVK